MYHSTLSPAVWHSFLLTEQLANVGSEVERSIRWRDKNIEYMTLALYRALELIDLTIGDPKNRTGLKEITRIREFLVDYFFGTNQYGFTDAFWRSYFMAFTLVASHTQTHRI